MFLRKTYLIIFIIFLLGGCAWSCEDECAAEKQDIEEKYGRPSEIDKFDATNYHTEDWWYWSKGICITFKWGHLIDECCETSTYTFSPIRKDIANKELVKQTMIEVLHDYGEAQ